MKIENTAPVLALKNLHLFKEVLQRGFQCKLANIAISCQLVILLTLAAVQSAVMSTESTHLQADGASAAILSHDLF